jgi:hypothetical protein
MNDDFISKYAKQRENLKKRFESERTGDQIQYTDQAKLFKPLIEIQKEATKSIGDKIVSGQDKVSNALVPFTTELQRQNDQAETLQNIPFLNIPPEIEAAATPKRKEEHIYAIIDLDGELLNEPHKTNLQDMGFPIPSVVQKEALIQEKLIQEILEKIKSKNKSHGQRLGSRSTANPEEKENYESQKETMKIYKTKIEGLKGAAQFTKKSGEGLGALVKPKRGRGRPKRYPDAIIYANPEDLIIKLHDLLIAKQSGNTGLDNLIVSVLDELLKIHVIDKDQYDVIYKMYFEKIV